MKRAILLFAAGLLACCVYPGFKYFTGSDAGGDCRRNLDCEGSLLGKYGSQCLAATPTTLGFCTNTCDQDNDCESGWTCQSLVHYDGDDQNDSAGKSSIKVCAPAR